MKAQMKILVEGEYNDDKFNPVIEKLKQDGWKLKRQYGGKLPNYKGHGAELEKTLL